MTTMQDRKSELLRELMAMEKEFRTDSIKQPIDVVPIAMAKIGKKEQEHFMVVALDGAYKVIDSRIVTHGTVNRTLVHPREVFRYAIKKNAVAVILAHNHPSGGIEPSIEDRDVTKRMTDAGEIVGIRVIDHVIVTPLGQYRSFLEHGEM